MYNDMTMYRNRNSVNIYNIGFEMVIIILFVCNLYDWLNDMIIELNSLEIYRWVCWWLKLRAQNKIKWYFIHHTMKHIFHHFFPERRVSFLSFSVLPSVIVYSAQCCLTSPSPCVWQPSLEAAWPSRSSAGRSAPSLPRVRPSSWWLVRCSPGEDRITR